ncbi:DUF4190 domain-containing protein [Leucobacter muris]|uniref:DUF4190 domain-containing protein n=1 Tax=Leucobacter muris TaxID=1935379 RepID=UPI001E3F9852|nr:DUF4190 domain-containing protein [Leucobacter muris]
MRLLLLSRRLGRGTPPNERNTQCPRTSRPRATPPSPSRTPQPPPATRASSRSTPPRSSPSTRRRRSRATRRLSSPTPLSRPTRSRPPYQQAYAAAPPTNTLAIIALISSFFISLAGVICGHIALKQIERTGESGRGLALAGLIIGYVGLAIGAIVVLFYVILIIGLASSSSY